MIAALALSCGLLATLPGPIARAEGEDLWGSGVQPVGGTVVRAFDPPDERWLPGHRGVDLGGAVGEPVVAAADGVVGFVGTIAGVPIVTVRHLDGADGGLRTTYEPVDALVSEGDLVSAGDVIGTLADGHCLAGCLHWGLRDGDVYLDPFLLLGVPRLRLLPTSDAATPRGFGVGRGIGSGQARGWA